MIFKNNNNNSNFLEKFKTPQKICYKYNYLMKNHYFSLKYPIHQNVIL